MKLISILLFLFIRDVYEKHQNQLSITIYPSEWFEVIDNCRLNLNNNDQVLFPDQYGENVFDKRTKISEFISTLEVHKTEKKSTHLFLFIFRISMVLEVISM